MSVEQEISDIIGDAENVNQESVSDETIMLALKKVRDQLSATDRSLCAVCARVQEATTRGELREAFRQFNEVMRTFTEAVPQGADDQQFSELLGSLLSSNRLESLLKSQPSVPEAISDYKTLIIQDLAVALRRKEELLRSSEEHDDLLFDRWLPKVLI